jgi:hypothetical protein
MNFKFSSLQHAQLASVELWIPTPGVSWISGCASSGVVVAQFLLIAVALPM